MVLCTCGHVMISHHRNGCHGDTRRSCSCKLNRYEALEAAVGAVRRRVPQQPATRGTPEPPL
ncbi:MAG TPA: hypothetical protein VGX96_20925 [Candidatus Elarobacter sp.]|jgi:hypothetical protein|nr:hypothetical protein [Candidatus Elarobacter sp.]